MSYREPIARVPRLWNVVIAAGPNFRVAGSRWVWAKEADEALVLAAEKLKVAMHDVTWRDVVCAEDFIEREAKGPPGPITKLAV